VLNKTVRLTRHQQVFFHQSHIVKLTLGSLRWTMYESRFYPSTAADRCGMGGHGLIVHLNGKGCHLGRPLTGWGGIAMIIHTGS